MKFSFKEYLIFHYRYHSCIFLTIINTIRKTISVWIKSRMDLFLKCSCNFKYIHLICFCIICSKAWNIFNSQSETQHLFCQHINLFIICSIFFELKIKFNVVNFYFLSIIVFINTKFYTNTNFSNTLCPKFLWLCMHMSKTCKCGFIALDTEWRSVTK